jgi:hypothetical protein
MSSTHVYTARTSPAETTRSILAAQDAAAARAADLAAADEAHWQEHGTPHPSLGLAVDDTVVHTMSGVTGRVVAVERERPNQYRVHVLTANGVTLPYPGHTLSKAPTPPQ